MIDSITYGSRQFRDEYSSRVAVRLHLLWVVVVANLVAMLFQALSAKVGIVTGRNLAELCRDPFRDPYAT